MICEIVRRYNNKRKSNQWRRGEDADVAGAHLDAIN